MAINRGKQFEEVVREAFVKVPDVSVTRLHDQTMGYLGARNPCDFIIYHKPYLYAIECKSTHAGTLSIYSNDPKKMYGAITNYQWQALLEMSTVKGVTAGVLCWWIDRDVTKFIPIQMLQAMRDAGKKSISWQQDFFVHEDRMYTTIDIIGKKKRVLFDYDMKKFLHEAEND